MIGTGTSSTGTRPLAMVGLLALAAASIVVGALAAGAATNSRPRGDAFGVAVPAATASPSANPTPSPSASPTAAPPEPVHQPAESEVPGRDAIPLTVDLANETGDEVYVDIADNSGLLVDAASGTPGGGASVEPYKLQVENIDSRTLRLTWSDYAIPNALALYIDETARRFVLVQPEPKGDVDAMVHDRVLVLTFSEPISSDDIEAILQDGLDV